MKHRFFDFLLFAGFVLCLVLPSAAPAPWLTANEAMDHNSDGAVNVLDVAQVLHCVVGTGPCATTATCNWATQTWNGSACVSLVIDPTTVCTAGQLYDIANAKCVDPVEEGLNCWAAGFCYQADVDWNTGLPNASLGPATDAECIAAGSEGAWKLGAKAGEAGPSYLLGPSLGTTELCASN